MNFHGTANGLPATLEATVDGDVWRGEVAVAGERYVLEARLTEGQLQGVVTEAATGQQAPLIATVDGARIEILAPVQGQFLASDDVARPPDGPDTATAAGTAAHEHDARLIGNWLWTDSSFSGDISITLQQRLVLNADGTYQYGDAKALGSGVGVSVGSGDGGAMESGRWRSEDSVLWRSEGPTFVPYARYSTDGGSLLLTFPDGSKRLWQRN